MDPSNDDAEIEASVRMVEDLATKSGEAHDMNIDTMHLEDGNEDTHASSEFLIDSDPADELGLHLLSPPRSSSPDFEFPSSYSGLSIKSPSRGSTIAIVRPAFMTAASSSSSSGNNPSNYRPLKTTSNLRADTYQSSVLSSPPPPLVYPFVSTVVPAMEPPKWPHSALRQCAMCRYSGSWHLLSPCPCCNQLDMSLYPSSFDPRSTSSRRGSPASGSSVHPNHPHHHHPWPLITPTAPSTLNSTASSNHRIDIEPHQNYMNKNASTVEDIDWMIHSLPLSYQPSRSESFPPIVATSPVVESPVNSDPATTVKQEKLDIVVCLPPSSSSSSTEEHSIPKEAFKKEHLRVPVQPDKDKSKPAAVAIGSSRFRKAPVIKKCKIEGCHRGVRSKGLCKGHGGGLRCQFPRCVLSDQGGGFCIQHGGGKRCKIENCRNSTQSRGLCKRHGGGTRCSVKGCTQSSQGGGKCRKHGGGKRCAISGCNKMDRRSGLCVIHGEERRCKVPKCMKTSRNEGYCLTHYLQRHDSSDLPEEEDGDEEDEEDELMSHELHP